MNRYVWIAVVMFLGGISVAQAQQPAPNPDKARQDAFRAIEMRERQLQLKDREVETAFIEKMKYLEIEKRQIEIEKMRQGVASQPQQHKWQRCHGHPWFGIMVVCLALHILLPVWVYQDIRKRNEGSKLWIVITLLTGFFGGLLYCISRIGDRKANA